MFSGWSLPPEQPVSVAQTIDYRSEIIIRVVDPCFLDSVKRNRVEGVSDQDMLTMVKVMQADTVDSVIATLLPIVQEIDTLEQRAVPRQTTLPPSGTAGRTCASPTRRPSSSRRRCCAAAHSRDPRPDDRRRRSPHPAGRRPHQAIWAINSIIPPDLPVAVENALDRFAESGPPARFRQTDVGAHPVYKERLPLGRVGKRGGARLVAYRDDELVPALFVYVKSDRTTISPDEIRKALDAAGQPPASSCDRPAQCGHWATTVLARSRCVAGRL